MCTYFLVFLIIKLLNKNSKDLYIKSFFSNIKNQGIWGEEQLSNLLNELLSSEQFSVQARVDPKSDYIVDAVIKIPTSAREQILLPIDSKLPLEDYMNFMDSDEEINYKNAKKYIKKLESKIKAEAKSINEKYIKTPYTTDFAIIFLPVESLYYLLIQNTEFVQNLRQEYKILLSSPSSLAAILNSVTVCFKYAQVEELHRDFFESFELLQNSLEDLDLNISKSDKRLEDLYKSFNDMKSKSQLLKRNLNAIDKKIYT